MTPDHHGTLASRQRRLFVWAIINHFLWSTLAVASRYLQVYASPQTFNGMAILATCKATSALVLFLYNNTASCSVNNNTTSSSSSVDAATGAGDESCTQTQKVEASSKTRLVFAILFGSAAACRACFNMASTKYTLSYNISEYNTVVRWTSNAAPQMEQY
jgi:hypothetical protein